MFPISCRFRAFANHVEGRTLGRQVLFQYYVNVNAIVLKTNYYHVDLPLFSHSLLNLPVPRIHVITLPIPPLLEFCLFPKMFPKQTRARQNMRGIISLSDSSVLFIEVVRSTSSNLICGIPDTVPEPLCYFTHPSMVQKKFPCLSLNIYF